MGRLYEDVIVTPQLFLKSRKTVFICDELYHYYSNDNSIVHTQTYDNQKQSTMAFIQAFETIEKNIPAYIDDYSGIFCKKMIHHHHSILTYRTKDNENYIFARHIENILKRFLTIKFFKKHPLIFIRIFLMRIKKCYITNTRFIRIGIYKLLAAVNSKKKKRYLEKIEKES